MRFLPNLFANNRTWAEGALRRDPNFFERMSTVQEPDYLWIGCADSRVPANEIVGLAPGELFVHRNVANLVPPGDVNVLSVLQFAVDSLRVGHVIVCGHYGCGGVLAALREHVTAPLAQWLEPVRACCEAHEAELRELPDEISRWRRLCELNVRAQVQSVCETWMVRQAWARGQPLVVHGWMYDLGNGLLRDLDVSVSGENPQ